MTTEIEKITEELIDKLNKEFTDFCFSTSMIDLEQQENGTWLAHVSWSIPPSQLTQIFQASTKEDVIKQATNWIKIKAREAAHPISQDH